MKFNKSTLFVILLIIIIIPVLTRRYLGEQVEAFTSTGCPDNHYNMTLDNGKADCYACEQPTWKKADWDYHCKGSTPDFANACAKTSCSDKAVAARLSTAGCKPDHYNMTLDNEKADCYACEQPTWKKADWDYHCNGPTPDFAKFCAKTSCSDKAVAARLDAAEAATNLGSCSSLSAFGEEDGNDPFSILNNIKYFQQEEITILNKLKTLANEASPNQSLIEKYTTAIVPFQQSRMRLMKQLNNVSSQTQCSLATDRKALQDQVALLSVVESQLVALEKDTNRLIAQKTGKKRMVEITNYENLRYTSHKNIFKTIAFCSLFVLAGINLKKVGGAYTSWLGYPIIVTAIAVAAILTIKKIWWNAYRNPMNWNQFIWDSPAKNTPSVWEYDMNSYNIGKGEVEDGINSVANSASNALNKGMDDINKLNHNIKGMMPKAKNTSTESFSPYN